MWRQFGEWKCAIKNLGRVCFCSGKIWLHQNGAKSITYLGHIKYGWSNIIFQCTMGQDAVTESAFFNSAVSLQLLAKSIIAFAGNLLIHKLLSKLSQTTSLETSEISAISSAKPKIARVILVQFAYLPFFHLKTAKFSDWKIVPIFAFYPKTGAELNCKYRIGFSGHKMLLFPPLFNLGFFKCHSTKLSLVSSRALFQEK